MKNTGILAGLLLGTFCGLVGCSQETIDSAKKDVDRNTEVVKREAKRVEEKAKPVIEAAKPVTDAVKKEAGKKLEQGKIGARVTAALKANANLPSTIRVDADEDAGGVKLRGKVKTAEQKQLAERVAKDTIGKDKTVQNDLKVEP
jgi:osmotically-inducible protein OsmY